jgi:hypothetical protein
VSISSVAINGSSVVQESTPSLANQLQQSFRQLTNSLQSGNLTTAQKAFSTIQSALKSSQTSTSTSSKPPVNVQSIQDDVGALRQALGSGDLSSALRAYTKLQNDLRFEEQVGGSGSAVSSSATTDSGSAATEGSGPVAKTGLYA